MSQHQLTDRVPNVWKQHIADQTPFGIKALAAIEKISNRQTSPIVREPPITDVGTRLVKVIEQTIGCKIVCGTCLQYLHSLNRTSIHNHDKIVEKLAGEVSWPNRMKHADRVVMVSDLILPIVPKYSVPTPKNPIDKPKDRDWACVVTTAPRKESTLEKCLSSVRLAGWEPVVFAEPESQQVDGVKAVINTTRLGAWHNWLQSVRWALRHTESRYILTVQDDSLFHPDSRSFVESVMWPSTDTGFLSLYTASHYSVEKDHSPKPVGINRIKTGSLWGACALVFPRHVLQELIEHPIAQGWTGVAPGKLSDDERVKLVQHKLANPYLIQNLDTAIGKILNALHLHMYFIDPSPVQHIAVHSAISHGDNTGKRNCGRCANPKQSLIEQVFPNSRK